MLDVLQENLKNLDNKFVIIENNDRDEVIRVLNRINTHTDILCHDADTTSMLKKGVPKYEEYIHIGVNTDIDKEFKLWVSNYSNTKNMTEITIQELEEVVFKGFSIANYGYMGMTLNAIVEEYSEGEPLDGDSVDALVEILRAKIQYNQGNITEDEMNEMIDNRANLN